MAALFIAVIHTCISASDLNIMLRCLRQNDERVYGMLKLLPRADESLRKRRLGFGKSKK
jgi:hypothetical protein